MRFLVLGKKILSPLELTDVVLILIAFFANCAWYASFVSRDINRNIATLISCLAVFFRLPFNNTQLKRAIEVFIRIAPVMVDLICLLFIILYLLANVGMELFKWSPVRKGEHMYLEQCGIGFNTFACSCIVLFQMVTTSNWHEIMNSVVQSTQTYWSSMYFVLAYIVVNMVVMNLFVAIAIEAFNKLASNEDQQNTVVGRHLSDQRPITAKPSVKKQAVDVLNSFASSIFGSARAEQVAGRRQSLASPTIGIKRGSNAVAKNNNDPLSEDDEKSEEENDFKGDKRERKLKKRMKEKKKTKRKISNAGGKVRVVTAFKGASGSDLDLTVGDEVTIIQKTDNWWQGHCKNRVGWFPASHVVMGTVKAVPEYRRKKDKTEPDSDTETGDVNHTQVIELTHEKTPPPVVGVENSFMRERAGTLSSQPPGTPPVRGRLKIKKTGDWRKEILGEMTVMNAEELRELNNIMRAELRTPDRGRSRTKKMSTLGLETSGDTRDSVFPEEAEFADEQGHRPTSARSGERPYSSRYNMRPSSPAPGHNAVRPYNAQESRDKQDKNPRVPDLFIAPGTPTTIRRASEQRKQSKGDIKKLKVKNLPAAPTAKTKENKKEVKKGNGEMPDWMVKFVNDKKLTVGDDVKLDETKHGKGRRSSSTSGVSTRTGTGTSKSTSSTLKTGTGTLKARSTGNIPHEVESSRASKSTPNVRKKSQAQTPGATYR